MGFPNIPDINPVFEIDRDEVIDLILASIGLEELSLAHLINAEAEKIQRALGTLQIPGTTGEETDDFFGSLVTDLDGLLAINRSVNKTMKFLVHKEFLLLTKLEDVLDFSEEENGNGGVTCCTNTIGFWRRVGNILPSYLPIFLGTPEGTFTEEVTTAARAAEIAATTGGLYDQLRAQLIAAKLNIVRCGVETNQLPEEVVDAINDADAFLAANNAVTPEQATIVGPLVETLDAFNNGAFEGFPHCD